MEDVLAVSTRPADPRRPQVCLDETSRQLLADARPPRPPAAGRAAREDYESARGGVGHLFLVCEPLAGRRHVTVSDRRTRIDWADVIQDLVDVQYPDAEVLELVQDNRNTHTPASLDEAFPAAEAKRLADKLELHYTPKHGSWLNMAEVELSALAEHCLDRRLADRATLAREVAAWERRRNAAARAIDWRFTTADARIKLKRLYPVFHECWPTRLILVLGFVLAACAQPSQPTPTGPGATPTVALATIRPAAATIASPTVAPTATAAATAAPTGAAASTPAASPTASPATATRLPATAAATPAAERGAWAAVGPMPTPRSEVGGAALDGRIYVAGGFLANGDTSPAVEVYEPARDGWRAAAPLPEPRNHLALATVGGKLYATGGYARGLDRPTRDAWVYDPAANAWKPIAPLPLPRAAHAAAEANGRLVVVGGVGDDPARPLVYDPAADRWTPGAPMPDRREHLAAAGHAGKVYAIAGRWGGGNLGNVAAYDPAADAWATLPPLPTPRSGLAAAAIDGKLYVTGGEALTGGTTFPQLEIFDIAAGRWSTGPPLPTARHGVAGVALDGRFYVLAGGPTAGLSTTGRIEVYSP
jgi:N-acetylneuraminic acid mutarotase